MNPTAHQRFSTITTGGGGAAATASIPPQTTTTTPIVIATATKNNSKLLKQKEEQQQQQATLAFLPTIAPLAMSTVNAPLQFPATVVLPTQVNATAVGAGTSLLHVLPMQVCGGAAAATAKTSAGAVVAINAATLQPQPIITTTSQMSIIGNHNHNNNHNVINNNGNNVQLANNSPNLMPVLQLATGHTGGSLLLRNQPHFMNATAATSAAQRTLTLPILNQELVKQIVVGSGPRAAAATVTLCKKPIVYHQQKQQQQKQQLQPTQQQQTQPLLPKPRILAAAATTPAAVPASKTTTTTLSVPQNKNVKTTLPAQIVAARNKTASAAGAGTITASTFADLFKTAVERSIRQDVVNTSRPLKSKLSTFLDQQPIEKQMQSLIKENPQLNKNENAKSQAAAPSTIDEVAAAKCERNNNNNIINNNKNNGDHKTIMPKLAIIKEATTKLESNPTAASNTKAISTVETENAHEDEEPLEIIVINRQKSLLKSKNVPNEIIVELNESPPRSKRAKSLNSALAKREKLVENGERRYSTASEGNVVNVVKCSSSSSNKYMVEEAKEKNGNNREDDAAATSTDIDTDTYSIEYLEDMDEGNKLNTTAETDNNDDENTIEDVANDAAYKDQAEEKIEAKNKETKHEKADEKDAIVELEANVTDKDNNAVSSTQSEDVELLLKPIQIKTELDEFDLPKITTTTPSPRKQQPSTETTPESFDKSLLCDEQISLTSSSSTSLTSSITNNHNNEKNNATAPTTTTSPKSLSPSSSANMLNMLSTFNMLTWKERIGTARGTNIRFQLNDFNLLQVHERCLTRNRIHTAYEKPIYEREALPATNKEQTDPLLYLCRRCSCHGPAEEFLAPEFCSLECLKRDVRKRQRTIDVRTKRSRKDTLSFPKPLKAPRKLHSESVAKQFRWSSYLTAKCGAIPAPVNLFLNPFPTGPNRFQIGMKLEAIDPENCSLFCICTVTDIQGYRLKLTFDDYECMYDFWVNADSMDIFPPGWCLRTNRILQPPKSVSINDFNWNTYLGKYKSVPAQRQLFTHLNSLSSRNPFKIGMHLEAEDLNDTGKLCVARVADVLDDRIRIHFDGWDDCYDYWVDISSPYIHPCGWHEGRQQLIVPPDFETTSFNWNDYICYHGSGMAAHEELFVARDPINFKPSMKLEVVDPRNPSLIRPATVTARKGHRIKLHLDGWPNDHCFWLEDDSPDLHPIGWCDATGHDLEPPPGYQMRAVKLPCEIDGCRGIGNAKCLYLSTHAMRDCCPYAPENWRQKVDKPPRLEGNEIITTLLVKSSAQKQISKQKQYHLHQQQQQQQQHLLSDIQMLERIKLLDNIKPRSIVHFKPQKNSVLDYREDCAFDKLLSIKKEFEETIHDSENVDEAAAGAFPPPPPLPLFVKAAATSNIRNESTNGDAQVNKQQHQQQQQQQQETHKQEQLEPCLNIAKHFLCDYGPRLKQNYDIWQKNFDFNIKRIKRNPLYWSTHDTSTFVESILKCQYTAQLFLDEDIDGQSFLLLQQSDLSDILGLKLGPAVKLYSYILQLRTLAVCKFECKNI